MRQAIATLTALCLLIPACGPTDGSQFNARTGCEISADSEQFPEDFRQACQVQFDLTNRLLISGEIPSPRSVEVFDLGPLSMGDRLLVTCVTGASSRLDPMIALFDMAGQRVFWNDDIDLSSGNLHASFDGIIRHDSDHYFIAVTNSLLNSRSGAYTLTAQLQPDAGLASLRGQTVLLHWAPADDVVVSGNDYGDLLHFNARTIDEEFEGRSVELKAAVLDIVTQDYAPYDVRITTTDDPRPTENFTSVYFSDGPSGFLFGLSDRVDFYNELDEDNAIIFLRSYSGLSANLEPIAQALANVVSHEIGHTLGLMHTADATTLMDTIGSDASLLVDQQFGTAGLYDFPIGFQNAPLLLFETVGPRDIAGVDSILFDDGQYRCGTCGATFKHVTGR